MATFRFYCALATAVVLLVGSSVGWTSGFWCGVARGAEPAITKAKPPLTKAAPRRDRPVRLAAGEEKRKDASGGIVIVDSLPKDIAARLLKYEGIVMKRRSDAEMHILRELDNGTQMEFVEAPLGEVVEYLKVLHNINIVVDNKALDAIGVTSDTPMTYSLKDVSLRSGLLLLFRDLDLTYLVKHDVVLITSQEVAETKLETRVYNVQLLDSMDIERVASVVEAALKPSKGVVIQSLPGCLVVTHSQRGHNEVADVLSQLRTFQTGVVMRRKLLEEAKQRALKGK